MLPILLQLTAPALALPSPSLGVAIASEHGPDGADLTLDVHNTALTARGERTTATFLPLMVSWDFSEDPSSPKIADRLELGILRTDRVVEADQLVVGVTVLDAQTDYDMGLIEATALGSDVTMLLLDGIMAVSLGLEIRWRAHLVGTFINGARIIEHQALVGIPLTVQGFSPPELPWFARGSFRLRPNPVAYTEVEESTFFMDLEAEAAGGYTLFDGEEVDIDGEAMFSWISDGGAYPRHIQDQPGQASFSEWTLSAGVSLVF